MVDNVQVRCYNGFMNTDTKRTGKCVPVNVGGFAQQERKNI